MRVGFVGLGDQGEPMAHRILQAGHELHIYARRPAQTRTLVARGGIEEPSLAALAECSELIGICMGTDAQTLDVAEQLLAASPPRSVLAIHSTVHPQLCQEIGRLGAQRDVSVVDAPVSGGRERAYRGELTVMVGGDAEAARRACTIFDAFGAMVVHVGPLGAGQTLKLVNNYLFRSTGRHRRRRVGSLPSPRPRCRAVAGRRCGVDRR